MNSRNKSTAQTSISLSAANTTTKHGLSTHTGIRAGGKQRKRKRKNELIYLKGAAGASGELLE